MFCPTCHSPKLIKCGFDYDRQRYECKVCNRKSVNPIKDLELIQDNVRLA